MLFEKAKQKHSQAHLGGQAGVEAQLSARGIAALFIAHGHDSRVSLLAG